ncbi:hypothetical protein GCM10022220_18970 [Actinocatenispora rupis]|uniref:Uncharacterized protein n=1 Tax=Actinocatenispora rupis TaxID=519421 RepID=A0A8J3IY34_9ACTN|nr:hypothetical protein Aru02nite_17790 [Actinocatenispora rupis]
MQRRGPADGARSGRPDTPAAACRPAVESTDSEYITPDATIRAAPRFRFFLRIASA